MLAIVADREGVLDSSVGQKLGITTGMIMLIILIILNIIVIHLHLMALYIFAVCSPELRVE